MDMVFKCLLKTMDDTNKNLDALAKQLGRIQTGMKRSKGLSMIAIGIGIYAVIKAGEAHSEAKKARQETEEIKEIIRSWTEDEDQVEVE